MLKKVIFKNFKSNIKNYLLFFLSNTLAVSLMLVFWGLRYNLGKSIKEEASAYVMNMDFMTASVMLSVVAIFLTVYAVQNYVKLRIKDYSMLTVLGISKKTFQKIIFAEYGLGWVLSVAAGLLFGNVIYYLFQEILFNISPSFLVRSIIGYKQYLYTLGVSLSIVLVVVIVMLTIIEGKNLDTYAAGKEVKEVKPKSGKWMIFVAVGVILLFVGNYRYHIGSSGPFIAQVMWLVAAFFILCIGGSILLESLIKRKRFYFKNLFRLNQLNYRFATNYLIIYMLYVIHFFALGYLANGIAECFPLQVDENLYPYDFVWYAQEKDEAFIEKVADKYHGSVKEFPMIRVAANGLDNNGISESTYEQLTGKECNLKEGQIVVVMEMSGRDKTVSDKTTIKLFERIHLGKYRGETATVDSYDQYGYQKVTVKELVAGNIIGQMVDGFRDNCIVLSNKMFEEGMDKIINDPEEPSILTLFQIPEKYQKKAGKELEKYVDEKGVEEFADLQSNFYNIREIIDGTENRSLFQFSGKLFIIAALLFSSIFILKMKVMSEEDLTVRRYSFLNCMGMPRRKRIGNTRFEIRCVSAIPLICGLIMGIDYTLVSWDAYRGMGDELPHDFWKMLAIVVGIYLVIQILGTEWAARTESARVEKKIGEDNS